MKLSRRYFYIYFLMWGLYYLQGTLYASGGLISKSLLTLILIISGGVMFVANGHMPKASSARSYIVSLNFLTIILTIYGLLGLFVGEVYGFSSFRLLRPYYCSMLPIYSFYLFSKNNEIRQIDIKIFFLLMLCITVAFYYKNYEELMSAENVDGITNNVGYMFVPFVALLPLINSGRLFKYLIIIILSYFVLMSAKRGAMICFVLCLFLYLVFEERNSSFKTKIIIFITSSILLVIGYHYAMETILSDPYLSNRLIQTLDGDSSSRDVIFSRLYDRLLADFSPINFIFGYGIHGTLIIATRLAHNDWLEFLIDMGLIGFVVYLLYWLSFFRVLMNQKNKENFAALFIIMSFCFVRTLFSQSLSDMYIITTFIIGHCIAHTHLKEIKRASNSPTTR